MNEGERKSQVASPEARKACALELRSEHKLHATKHDLFYLLVCLLEHNLKKIFIE